MSISWQDSSAIDLASSEGWEGMEVDNVKPHVDRFVFPDVHRVTVLASSRLLNLGGATGHPPFVVLFVFIYPHTQLVELVTCASCEGGRFKSSGRSDSVHLEHQVQLRARTS